MERRVALARLAAGGRRLAAPKQPKVAKVGSTAVTLRWKAPKGAKPALYQVVRNGRVVARTTHLSSTDRHGKAGHTYRYAVRGVDKHGRRGNISDAVRVKVPKKKSVPSTGSPPLPPVTPASDQIAGQDPQLKELSRALGSFKADLTARGIEDRVCMRVFSEFGRRVEENGSAGTDHGAGGLMLAMGSGVRGGLAAEWPGCETTERKDGNIKVPTDFRSVYRSVIEEWLGDDYQAVLGGGTIKPLVRGDGLTGRTLFR
jgi:Protein of unknown function (DUF1501)